MGLRDWTRNGIEGGGTLYWSLSLSIKLIAEVVVALFLAYAGTKLLFFLFPLAIVKSVTGFQGFPVVWLAASIALFLSFTKCEYTSPLGE